MYFQRNDNCIILPGDKEVALVIMDKDMYITKCMVLLDDGNFYKEWGVQ